ncbi:MAG: M20/M25/M40 family metallo-hydrolase [Planctomycetes bacterium]|nr:M20/M25/M40 family metallo-hydrolase [Planctomycetota bacterium]
MRRAFPPFLRAIPCALLAAACAAPGGGEADPDPAAAAARILVEAREGSRAMERLRELCGGIGHRLSGSAALDRAVAWAQATMRADGLENVRAEPVLVPHWERGRESASFRAGEGGEWVPLDLLGLGNSVGTPEGGIEADLVVARDFAALEALGESVRGKVVLFDFPMRPFDPVLGPGYGEAVAYRVNGPSRAARQGAAAVLLRSVTDGDRDTPHTGMLRYAEDAPRIPAAAVTVNEAERLAALAAAGAAVRVRLSMEARFLPDVPSANVVGEIVGRERPEEIVLIGGHLDSWDVGEGAHDDGAPCVAVMEAARILRALGLRPRRTIRVVLFTNEENGLAGGRAYARDHEAELPRHVVAIEADSGAFRPLGFTTPAVPEDASPGERARREAFRERLREAAALLAPLGADRVRDGGGGADIAPMEPAGVPQAGLDVWMEEYFDLHHTRRDVVARVREEELTACAAALAIVAWDLARHTEPDPKRRDSR